MGHRIAHLQKKATEPRTSSFMCSSVPALGRSFRRFCCLSRNCNEHRPIPTSPQPWDPGQLDFPPCPPQHSIDSMLLICISASVRRSVRLSLSVSVCLPGCLSLSLYLSLPVSGCLTAWRLLSACCVPAACLLSDGLIVFPSSFSHCLSVVGSSPFQPEYLFYF